MLYAESRAGLGVKAEEVNGGLLARQKPVMWFHDDDREAIQGGGITAEELFFAPLISTFRRKDVFSAAGLEARNGVNERM